MSEIVTQPVIAAHAMGGEPVPAVKGQGFMVSRGPSASMTGVILRLNAAGTRAYARLASGRLARLALVNLETSPYA